MTHAKKELEFLGYENFSKDIWKVAKTLEWRKTSKFSNTHSKGLQVFEGDIIKMGRLKIKLRKIHLYKYFMGSVQRETVMKTAHDVEDGEEMIDHEKDISFQIKHENDEIPPCRFCLSNMMDQSSNPLINPCGCKGTQGLLHVD